VRIASLFLAAALPALAQAPADFRASAPITLGGKDALHQLELPYEVYRDARRDLADVRIFNSAREPVPIAWAGPPDTVLETATTVELPIFPVSTLQAVPGKGGDEVTVRTADGTLVSVRGKATAATVAKPAAYLLDASKTTERIRALVFDWKATPGNEVVTIRLDSSEDLKTWSPLAATPVLRWKPKDARWCSEAGVRPAQGEVLPPALGRAGLRVGRRARRVRAARQGGPAPGAHQHRDRRQGRRARLRPGRAPARRGAAPAAVTGERRARRVHLRARRARPPVGPHLQRVLLPPAARRQGGRIAAPGDRPAPGALLDGEARGRQLRRHAAHARDRMARESPRLRGAGDAPFDLAFGNAQASPTALAVSTLVRATRRAPSCVSSPRAWAKFARARRHRASTRWWAR
jgi:hypothetical protein